MRLRLLPAVVLVLAGPAHAAGCEGIRDGIDAKLRSAGVNDHRLSIVDTDAIVAGKVVGRCELGTKKIVLVRGNTVSTAPPPPAPAAPPPPAPAQAAPPKAKPLPMLTECKDGSTPADGVCRKKAAP